MNIDNKKNRRVYNNTTIERALNKYRELFVKEENKRRQMLKEQYAKMGDSMFIVE